MTAVSTPLKVVGFIAALVAVFGITLGAGRILGPVDTAPTNAGAGSAADTGAGHGSHVAPADETSADTEHAAHLPGGLQVSQDGYTLRLHHTDLPAGPKTPLAFVIEAPDGSSVTSFTPQHEKEIHLIAVRRDFSGFQHVHPTRTTDGMWSTTLALTPGAWRVFADMAPTGAEPMTLGADVSVAGTYAPAAEPTEDVRTANVDGYTVTLTGTLEPGADSTLALAVSRGGRPVTDLDPYLGAYGHLVALRAGDLAYLHVHPEGHPGDGTTQPGPDITFGTTVPSPGTYRLFLDFQHDGVVRTAEFTLTAGGTSGHQH